MGDRTRLLRAERLETILSTVLDRRQERSERQREHIADVNKRTAESEARLKRLYDAIETGIADLNDPALKDRIEGLKAVRDQAKADAVRAQAMLEVSGNRAVTPHTLAKFAQIARQRIRLEGGGYRRDHLRALAQRVEVADGEVRIMGSKSRLFQILAENGGNLVPRSIPKWRKGWDSNPRMVAHRRFSRPVQSTTLPPFQQSPRASLHDPRESPPLLRSALPFPRQAI